jgi:putative inorganic carbon (HCO3(-)) transporter
MVNRSKYSGYLKENTWIIGASATAIVFLIISMLLIRTGASFLWLIPPALLIASFSLLAIDRFLLLTVFLVPASVQLRFIVPDPPADIFLPTELMLGIILLLIIFKLINTKEIDRKILLHPVSIISFCILGWSLITSLTSTMPAVSIKSFITRLWFFAGFYILAAQMFRNPGRIRYYFLAYFAGMVPVAIYFLVRMVHAGIFDQKVSYAVVRPFFNDHTSFGAVLAFCIPVGFYLLFRRENSKMQRVLLTTVLLLFAAAFVFSYSRAAWLSLPVAAIFVLFIFLKISWKIVLPVIVAGLVIIFISWPSIIMRLNENKKQSSGEIENHIRSIANIRTDVSNMERVNRWKSAIRMFKEKPLLGWGPATYQFKYAPFQISGEKTSISTNYGEGGNAHSEYLGSLVDSGIPGMLLYILLLLISVRRGIIIWNNQNDKHIRYLVLALVAGLVTYVIHGGLNNFLDTDKISSLFWGSIAAIVAMDITMKEEANS